MTDKEKERDLWVAEAIEKVIPTPAKQPTLPLPQKNIAKGVAIGTTGITIFHSLPLPAKFIPASGVTIGKDAETGRPVTVTDKEREGGLYILGEPRMGKSTLMVSMALQDTENGHGLLFIAHLQPSMRLSVQASDIGTARRSVGGSWSRHNIRQERSACLPALPIPTTY